MARPEELLAIDNDGFPVLLADKPVEPEVTAPGLHVAPKGIDGSEWARRQDAVRAAAREFESFKTQDAREWLRGVTKRALTDQEVASFVADVDTQVVSDLVDVLDQQQRGVLRGRRTVRVIAPRGYMRKALASLSDEQLSEVKDRLLARGWNQKQVDEKFPPKPSPS